jgi:hypothetical protein
MSYGFCDNLPPHKTYKVVILNGDPFQLWRSTRQGCPLAPYIFLFIIDVLGPMLHAPRHEVEGLKLLDGANTAQQFFADAQLFLSKGI